MDTLVMHTRSTRETCFRTEAALMAELVQGQHPSLLYIGCSDSRILPSHILDAHPGTVFTTRNIANIVPPYAAMQQGEMGVVAVLEYAVLHLRVAGITTIQQKTRYALEQQLGGVMIWELGQDTSNDTSLLRAIQRSQ